PHNFYCLAKITCEGVMVGALTGFVGVGGGFLIVPALLMLEKLPIRSAIGTSLVIITMKSAIGFGKYQSMLGSQGLSVDFQTIAAFSVIGIAGCAIGQRLNAKMNQQSLKKVFAVFLVLIGAYVIFHEGGKLVESPSKSPALQIENGNPQTGPGKTSLQIKLGEIELANG
ncbi:MAG: putative membrane protein YfcA, partial [Mariniblastus sp.]